MSPDHIDGAVDHPALSAAAPIRGLIFDMDGTLVDNMHAHNDAWDIWHQRNSLVFDRDTFFTRTAGRSNAEVIQIAIPDVSQAQINAHSLEKEAIYRDIYAARMEPLTGLLALLCAWQSHNRPMAVATAAPPENVDLVLDGLDLRRHFVTVVSPSMGYRGKPHPDLFLAAARAMALEPEHCIVFEDAPLGIEAAHRAGMRAVSVTTMLDETALHAPNVLFSVKDFSSPRLRDLLGLRHG